MAFLKTLLKPLGRIIMTYNPFGKARGAARLNASNKLDEAQFDYSKIKDGIGAIGGLPTGGGNAASGVYTLTLATPPDQVVNANFTITGAYLNGTPTALEYTQDGGATWINANAVIGGGTFSATANFSDVGTKTIVARDKNNTAIKSNTITFKVNAVASGAGTGAYSLNLASPGQQTINTSYNINGTYLNGTPTALELSVDNGAGWINEPSAIIGGGTFSIPVSSTVAETKTIIVRDKNKPTVISNSITYVVSTTPPPATSTGGNASNPTPILGSTTDSQAYSLSHTGTLIPNLYMSFDAALPAYSSDVPAGSAGIKVGANGDVLQVRDPVNGVLAKSGYGAMSRVTSGGAGGLPYFKGNSSSTNTAYDSLTLPNDAARPFFAPKNGGWCVVMVIQQTGGNASGLMSVRGGANITYLGQHGDDASIYIEQNNGSALGSEPPGTLTNLNQLQVMVMLCDGQRMSLYRNGTRTAQTNTGNIGGVTANYFAFANNPQANIACIMMFRGAPSVAQLDAETKRLASRFGITVATTTDGPASAIAPPPIPAVDNTLGFLDTPNFPINDILPTRSTATPGNVTLTSGARQYFSYVFGSGQTQANVTNGQQVRDEFYMNYHSGNQNTTFGNPIDTGQGSNNTFAAVARHYPVGHPYDVHVVDSEGLKLKAFGSSNGQNTSPGAVWAGMIRSKAVFRPGMLLKVRYRSYKGNHGWAPIWFFTGEQRTPGSARDPYRGYNTQYSLIRETNKRPHEIDWNDNYPRFGEGCPTGRQLDFGCPDIYGASWGTPPHNVYRANGVGSDGRTYKSYPTAGPPFLDLGADLSVGFHDLLGNWRNDGSNLLDVFIDGKLVQTDYMEYGNAGTYTDDNGNTQTIGMHLIIGNQAIASFTPGHETATDNDGITDGWTIAVQEISAWYGNVANPDSYRAV